MKNLTLVDQVWENPAIYKIDILPEEAKRILQSAPIRFGGKDFWDHPQIEIEVNGKWHHLCRTDLQDDVCTYYFEDSNLSFEEVRKKYLDRIRWGVRTRGEPKRFAAIDSWSDG